MQIIFSSLLGAFGYMRTFWTEAIFISDIIYRVSNTVNYIWIWTTYSYAFLVCSNVFQFTLLLSRYAITCFHTDKKVKKKQNEIVILFSFTLDIIRNYRGYLLEIILSNSIIIVIKFQNNSLVFQWISWCSQNRGNNTGKNQYQFHFCRKRKQKTTDMEPND